MSFFCCFHDIMLREFGNAFFCYYTNIIIVVINLIIYLMYMYACIYISLEIKISFDPVTHQLWQR